MRNKKASLGITLLIMATLGVIVLAYIFIPVIKSTTSDLEYSELIQCSTGENQTDTLTFTTMKSGSLAVEGLTLTDNYTIDYDTGIVSFVNRTTPGNYSATYNYYSGSYLTDTSDRSLMAVLILLGIMGLIYFIAQGFGIA